MSTVAITILSINTEAACVMLLIMPILTLFLRSCLDMLLPKLVVAIQKRSILFYQGFHAYSQT